MTLYATDWKYTPEPRRYGDGTHHLVSGMTADGRRIDLVEIERDRDGNFDARMSDAEAAQIARLIAAAPVLLGACKVMVAWEDDAFDDDTAAMLNFGDALKAMRAAIAKAEGSE